MKKVIVVGSGFSGLACACFLAKKGFQVTLLEKNSTLGGRARQYQEQGFTFDMGPSWYWMPDVFERFYNQFEHTASDFYHLKRLSPSYRIFWEDNTYTDIPADFESLQKLCDSYEPHSGKKVMQFLKEAKQKYEIAMTDFVFKPSLSLTEYLDVRLLKNLFRMDLFTSMTKHIKQFVSHSKLRKILEFPVLFLGAVPAKTPALYSMMNYADLGLGTWYPMGGMYEIVKSFTAIAKSLSVEIHTDQEVLEVGMQGKKIVSLQTKDKNWKSDIIVASADYHHMESLLPESHRSYSERYWKSRTFAPSCLLYYLGLDTKLSKHLHHNLYFDADFEQACTEIYETHQYPKDPLFYLSCTSKTDPSVAPEGYENVFGLIPISTEIANEESVRERYLDTIIKRIYERTGEDISSHIIYKKFFSGSDFRNAYHAYKGNAYGLANTLLQTGPLKPRMRSKKISNLFYTGQLTVPGPGVPPSIISGEVVASYIERNLGK